MDTRVSRDNKALLPSNDPRRQCAVDGAARRGNREPRAARASVAENLALVLAVSLTPFALSACFGAEFTFTTSSVGTGGSGGQGGIGGDGGGGGTPAGCIPSESAEPIAEECGIHVSSSLGADGGPGTRAQPYRSLTEAIANANGKPIYACGEQFHEPVQVPAGVAIYGALACGNGWAYDVQAQTYITADPDVVPIKFLAGEQGIALQDFVVIAADASVAEGSSIAAIAEAVPLALTRVDLRSGQGMPGRHGETPMDSVGPTSPDDDAIRGNEGLNACLSTNQQLGGNAKTNDFCLPAGSIGGSGGNGAVANGSNGNAPAADASTALGGTGQPTVEIPGMPWSCAVGVGATGNNGAVGAPGLGAQGDLSLGTIDGAGYVGVPGQPGGIGLPGQGGGGGGGAKGKAMCAGASGGGGGVGGCGGNGGLGGGAGGASIALISLGATFSFEAVYLKPGNGGTGGDGGDGQIGGAGGVGGVGGAGEGTLPACRGGDGGLGGFGGKGGGGRGGHSIGLAYIGSAPSLVGIGFELGVPALGGVGDPGNDGEMGIAQNTQSF